MASYRIALAFVLGSFTVCAGQQSDVDLAHELADPGARKAAVKALRNSGAEKIPLLLSWTQKPPSGVFKDNLYIGLADAFGALKTEKALPFLIKYIDLNEFPYTNVWTRTPEAVLERMPAVRALILIGQAASHAVMHAYPSYTTPNERLAAMFVVSHIGGVPEARQFLSALLGQARVQQISAEEGFKNLERPSGDR